MTLDFNDLKHIPEIVALLATVEQQGREIKALQARQLKWVSTEQAEQITGFSRRTLGRHRQAFGSVIVFQPSPLRYDYDSLLRHLELRVVGRNRIAQLCTETL